MTTTNLDRSTRNKSPALPSVLPNASTGNGASPKITPTKEKNKPIEVTVVSRPSAVASPTTDTRIAVSVSTCAPSDSEAPKEGYQPTMEGQSSAAQHDREKDYANRLKAFEVMSDVLNVGIRETEIDGDARKNKVIKKIKQIKKDHEAAYSQLRETFEESEKRITARNKELTEKLEQRDKEHQRICLKLREDFQRTEIRGAAKNKDHAKRIELQEKEHQTTRLHLIEAEAKAAENHAKAGELCVELAQVKAEVDDFRGDTLRKMTKLKRAFRSKDLYHNVAILSLENTDSAKLLTNVYTYLDDANKERMSLLLTHQKITETTSEEIIAMQEQLDDAYRENAKLLNCKSQNEVISKKN